MNIDDAALATRKYDWFLQGPEGERKVCVWHGDDLLAFDSIPEAQTACDRLNLLAVLEAIREPSEALQTAAVWRKADQEAIGDLYASVYRAMIDALIAEVKHGAG